MEHTVTQRNRISEHEAGTRVSVLYSKRGVGDTSIYNWKSNLDEKDVSQAKRLKIS